MEVEWCVVSFEDGVQLVPKCWIQLDKCFWPTFTSNVRYEKAVKYCEAPEENWPLYKMRILGTFSSYETGKKKVKLAEEQSDLNTDPECSKEKRKIRKKKVLSSSDEEEPYDCTFRRLEPFPSIPTSSNVMEKMKPKQTISHISQGESSRSEADDNISNESYSLKSIDDKVKTTHSESRVISDEDFKTKLLRDVTFIKVNIIKLNQRMTIIENNLLNVSDQTLTQQTADEDDCYMEVINHMFPLASFEDLIEAEKKLQEPNFKTKLISYCGRIGGHKVDEIVKLILRKLFTNKVASLYSWVGAKKKKVFSSLALAEVVMSACRANKIAADAFEIEIVDSIKNWLRHASTRDKNSSRGTGQNQVETDQSQVGIN